MARALHAADRRKAARELEQNEEASPPPFTMRFTLLRRYHLCVPKAGLRADRTIMDGG